MSFKLVYTSRFKKHYKKFDTIEKKQIENKLRLLCENPSHPSLRSKKLKGLDGVFESSVNMDIRILWYYEDGHLIICVDVGHHNILDRL